MLILGIAATMWLYVTLAADAQMLTILLVEKLSETTLHQSLSERAFQHIIYNDEHWFFMLTGEGFGKYSPLIASNPLQQPDAPYHMIYNETGVLGVLVFGNMLIQIARHAIQSRNYFLLFIVVHFALQMMGSRILWYFPINFAFYLLIAAYRDAESANKPLFQRARLPVRTS